VPLLYPIAKKDYSQVAPYTKRAWAEAKTQFGKAFTLTMFGYGAPASDGDAIALLKQAWFNDSSRHFEHVEIIDIAPKSELYQRWSPFTPTRHYHLEAFFAECRLARWPRRSTESLFYPMSEGSPCDDFPLPITDNLIDLQAYAADIARHEPNVATTTGEVVI
jgi:hypothetical protein